MTSPLADLIAPADAARRAGVSSLTIKNWFDRGVLSGQKTALGRLVSVDDLDRLIAARETKRAPGRGGDDDPPTGSAA